MENYHTFGNIILCLVFLFVFFPFKIESIFTLHNVVTVMIYSYNYYLCHFFFFKLGHFWKVKTFLEREDVFGE